MGINLDEDNQAILLLSAHFSMARKGDPTPLTPIEYGRLSSWLHQNGYTPKDLFFRLDAVIEAWTDPKGKITAERLAYLLGRGTAMGLALEKWNSAGIWILTRADSDYPKRLRQKLGQDAPPILFGVGNRRLLNAGGLAMVGSRSIEAADQAYAQQVARAAAGEGLNVVSGAAKGVDETAMLAALEMEGTALGILANGLMSAALSGKWRSHLKSNQLCLISTYYPEASFHVGNAMGRNKYIYCLADYGLVVRSDKNKGGTWAGATEALKKALAPVFVNQGCDAAGNVGLIELGATPLPTPAAESGDWLLQALQCTAGGEAVPGAPDEVPSLPQQDLFFAHFVEHLQKTFETMSEVTLKLLKERHPDLTEKQITSWLERAVAEGLIERRGEAHRYTRQGTSAQQRELFDLGRKES